MTEKFYQNIYSIVNEGNINSLRLSLVLKTYTLLNTIKKTITFVTLCFE